MIEYMKSDGGRGDPLLLPSGKQQMRMWSVAIAGVRDASCNLAFFLNPHIRMPVLPDMCTA
jgi:hypothetical protein